MLRVILEWTDTYLELVEQLQAVNMAMRNGMKPGDVCGVRMGATGNGYGVKRNTQSVRVYRQKGSRHD